MEAAAYFCCVAAVRRLQPGAELRVGLRDDRLVVVAHGRRADDDGHEQALADRVAALDGQLTAGPSADGGFSLCAEIPAASDQAALSRSEPKSDFAMYGSALPAPASATVSSS